MINHRFSSLLAIGALSLGFAAPTMATPFTMTSPTSAGLVPSGVTEVGGIVFDMIGTNNTRVTSQLAASSLYVGYASSNPQVIGTQTGFTPAVIAALGGGIAEVAVRFTLYDGDQGLSEFDRFDNTLLLNGDSLGDWSNVITQSTNATGLLAGSTNLNGGFRDSTLDTGWFFTNNASVLASLYTSLSSTGQIVYSLLDDDSGDNHYDFTRGVDGGLINVGQPPVVQPPTNTAVPEPVTAGLSLMSLLAVSLAASRRRTV